MRFQLFCLLFVVFTSPVISASQHKKPKHGKPKLPLNEFSIQKITLDAPSERGVVTFRTAHAGFVSLRIFDVLGVKIDDIQNGELPAGEHTNTIFTNILPTGKYYLRLETKEGIRMKGFTMPSKHHIVPKKR